MKKRSIALLLLPVLLLALCSCGKDRHSSVLQLYYPVSSASRAVDSRDYDGPAGVEDLTEALLRQLFGGEIALVELSHSSNTVQLILSPEYGALSGIDRTLAECCIVLTLCQLDSVNWVRVAPDGAPVSSYPYLTPDDMIFTGAEEQPREFFVELYFPRSSGRGLGFEPRKLILTEDDDLYTEVTRALLAGPSGLGFHSPFPEGLEVLGSKLESGVCHINFSSHLLEVEASDAEHELLLYSIVDTLGNLDSVSSVQILVEGEILFHYGATDTSMPLEPDFGLVSD